MASRMLAGDPPGTIDRGLGHQAPGRIEDEDRMRRGSLTIGAPALAAFVAAAVLLAGAPAPHAGVPSAEAARTTYPKKITDATSFRTLWAKTGRDRTQVLRRMTRDFRAARTARGRARRVWLALMLEDIRTYAACSSSKRPASAPRAFRGR